MHPTLKVDQNIGDLANAIDAMVMGASADAFATAAHGSINQKRDFTGEDYITHPRRVADIVSEHTDDIVAICGAYLHDVVEDTPVTLVQIYDFFGAEVASVVSEVTNPPKDPNKNRAQRMKEKLADLAAHPISKKAQLIKLADIIDNCKDMIVSNPGFAKVYLAEKREFLPHYQNGSEVLFRQANKIIDEFLGDKNGHD